MSKIETVKADYLAARKSDNVLTKKLLSTLIGEFDNQSKTSDKSGDELLILIVKKMIKNTQLVNTEDAKKEAQILESYLPPSASEEDIKTFLTGLTETNKGKIIGLAKSHFNGNVDMSLLTRVINDNFKTV